MNHVLKARYWIVMFLFVALSTFTGCLENTDDGYGKVRSNGSFGGIDGLSGLAHLLEEAGCNIRVRTTISPVIDQADTIIWAPLMKRAPSEAAVERLEQWLSEGYQRKLILIVDGYRGRRLLLKKQSELVSDADRGRAIRRYNEHLIGWNPRQFGFFWDDDECDWYKAVRSENRLADQLGGPWVNRLDVPSTEIYTGAYQLRFPDDPVTNTASNANNTNGSAGSPSNSSTTYPKYRSERLLATGDQPLITQLSSDNFGDGQVLVISNGSFLLNLGLANPQHQELAGSLIADAGPEVIVLQSGPQPIEVRSSIVPENATWKWLTLPPIRLIVPFFLLIAVFTFFVVFPIHGRPRQIRLHPEKSFADHIQATGRLLNGKKNRQWAMRAVFENKQNKILDTNVREQE